MGRGFKSHPARLNMTIEALLWDFGGVIVRDNLKPAFQELNIPYNEQVRNAWKKHRLGQLNQEEFYKKALKDTEYINLLPNLRTKADELIELQPNGALPSVRRIFHMEKYKQGVISNHSKEWGKYIINKWNLKEILNPIIVSADIGLDKSSSLIFYYTLKLIKTKPENTIFIDNDPNNVNLANSIGINAILFHNAKQLREELRAYDIF